MEIKADSVKTLTDAEIDAIVDAASAVRQDDIKDIKVDPEAELEVAVATVDDETNEIDLIAKEVEDLDIDLFEAQDDDLVAKMSEEKKVSYAKDLMNLNEDEAFEFIEVVNDFRNNPNAKHIYSRLPEKIQMTINSMMAESGAPIAQRENISKMVLNEFVSNADVDEAFVDFEKALNEALNVPSVVDLYNEHTRDIMETKIPEVIESIKEEEPEKAEMLNKVKDAFKDSYSFIFAREEYENNSKLRKAVRQADSKLRSYLLELNSLNDESKFKMYDAFKMPDALYYALIEVPEQAPIKDDSINRILEMRITKTDINKFCVLISGSCEGKNSNNVVDAAYMYYMIKNVAILKHSKGAKTEFAAELINNICDVIALIRDKEAEFYEENPHLLKSKSSKKSHSTNGGKK